MFTGIIAAVGRITKTAALGQLEAGLRLTIDAGALGLEDVSLGDSISIQGACMTVVEKHDNSFAIDISRESLSKTVGLEAPGEVNLEKAVSLSTKLGGHLVTGHVDGLGEVVKFERAGESHELVVLAPRELAKFIAYKGSVTVNGVSLTVNRVTDVDKGQQRGAEFSINLIPHTVAVTTLKTLKAGAKVNLEIDLIARYVERMMTAAGAAPGQ